MLMIHATWLWCKLDVDMNVDGVEWIWLWDIELAGPTVICLVNMAHIKSVELLGIPLLCYSFCNSSSAFGN